MNKIIDLEELENAKDGILNFKVKENINGINSVGPIEADLMAKLLGEFVEISGNVKGIVKLECDRCLKEFDYKVDYELDELFAKNTLLEEYSQETEIKEGQFVTDLCGSKEIDIYDLLYQSVILNLPNKKVCGINCNVDKFSVQENLPDPRLDIFRNIKVDDCQLRLKDSD